jgi:hypothetical protein
MTPAVVAKPVAGGTAYSLAPSVAANAPLGKYQIVAPTTQVVPYGGQRTTVTTPAGGATAYDPVFGLWNTGAINQDAYAAAPQNAPKPGGVFDTSGSLIGTQTPTGFFGNPSYPAGPTMFSVPAAPVVKGPVDPTMLRQNR